MWVLRNFTEQLRPGEDGREGVLPIRLVTSVVLKVHLEKLPSKQIVHRSNSRLRTLTTISPSTKTQSRANLWVAKILLTSLNLSSRWPWRSSSATSALHQLPIATEQSHSCSIIWFLQIEIRISFPTNSVFHVLRNLIFSFLRELALYRVWFESVGKFMLNQP